MNNKSRSLFPLSGALLALVIYLLGFATPFWKDTGHKTEGLWTECVSHGPLECSPRQGYTSPQLRAVQVVSCITLALYIAALITHAVFMCREDFFPLATAILLLTASILCLLSIVLYGALPVFYRSPALLGWSYILVCVSFAISFTTSVIMLSCDCR